MNIKSEFKLLKNDNLKNRLNRNKDFIERNDTDCPLYGVHILGNNYMMAYKETCKNIPRDRKIEPEDISTRDFLIDIDNFIQMQEQAGGDLFYPVVPYFYLPWMEAIIGCSIYLGRDSFYAEPFIKSWQEFNWEIDLSCNNRWYSKLIELKESLVEHIGDRYPIGSSTHLRGPIDMTSAAIGQTKFCLELYDNPEKIKKLAGLCTDTFIKVAKKENELAEKSKFGGYIVNNYGVWTPYVCQYYQDDALAFISPKIYKDFFLEEHLKIDSNFNSNFFHVHPISSFVVDNLIEFPNLDVIEINREPMGPSVEELLPIFKKIQKAGKSLLINFTTVSFNLDLIEKETTILRDNLSEVGLCIYISIKDVSDGKRKLNLLKRILGK